MLPEVEAVSLVGVGVTFASAVGVPLGAARLTGAGACVEVAASGGAAYVPSHAWVTSLGVWGSGGYVACYRVFGALRSLLLRIQECVDFG